MAWVSPLLEALQQSAGRWQVTLAFWPRLFLSGREAETAARLPGVSLVLTPLRALALAAGAPLPWAGGPVLPTLVLHMGGPASLSLRLGRRLRAPVLAYGEQPQRLPSGFNSIYCTDARESTSGATLIGNLLVDSVAGLRGRRSVCGPGAGGPLVGLLPGSRALQLRHYLPRIEPLVEAVALRVNAVRFLIARSPLVNDTMLREALGTHTGARLVGEGDEATLVTRQGLRIPLRGPADVLGAVHCLVSTPGTNTGEAAALGIPHLVVAPFDPTLPLLTGLPRLIEISPWPGRPLKRWALRRLTGGVSYYAQANARAGREIVPELQGPLDVARVSERLVDLLLDARWRERMSRELAGVMGPPGAARRLVSELERQVRMPGPQ